MCIQDVDNVYDLVWAVLPSGQKVSYGDVHKQDELQWSHHNFTHADVAMYLRHFDDYYQQALTLLKEELVLPAYDYALKCSHLFNVLDARGAISVTERVAYIGRIRTLTKNCAETYLASRLKGNVHA